MLSGSLDGDTYLLYPYYRNGGFLYNSDDTQHGLRKRSLQGSVVGQKTNFDPASPQSARMNCSIMKGLQRRQKTREDKCVSTFKHTPTTIIALTREIARWLSCLIGQHHDQ